MLLIRESLWLRNFLKWFIHESLCSRNKFLCLIRESLCQKFHEFWHSRKFLLAKVYTPKVYNSTQSGFRKGQSIETLLLKIMNDIQKALNRNEITMSVMIDYSKAFDTIDHECLIRKLSLNFSNSSIKIILSYLTNQKQYVQVNDKQSTRLPIYFGVPQGSILGLVLFNIYVAKLSTYIESNSIQYADNNNIYKSSSKANTIQP